MNKTVLVTGSARGIGKSIILEFAKNNYNVVINYLNSKKEALELKNTVENLYNVKALAIKADVTSENDVKNMLNTINKEFSNIDVLINNAVYENDDTYFNKTKEDFMKTFEVNVFGVFNMIKEGVKYIKNGTIINISSTDSVDTYGELTIDYSASKAAVNSITKSLALAIPNIKFISILLPWIDTESTRSMFKEYLESELKRTNQKKLLGEDVVSKKVYNLAQDNDIKSGSLIRIF